MIRHNNIHTNITIIMFTTAFWWHVEKKGYLLYSFTLQWCQSRTLSRLTFWSARRHHADEKFQKTMATRLFRVILVRRGHDPFGQNQYIFGAEQNNRRLWSGTENVAKTVRFLFFAESKPWATKWIVVTTRVGPTNVSSLAFVFALTPGAGFGTTTTDRRWSSPSCISTIPKPRALTVCRKLFTELMTTKILCIKWSSPVVCSHKQNL